MFYRPTEEDAEYARMSERYEEEWEFLLKQPSYESVLMVSCVWPSGVQKDKKGFRIVFLG